MYGLTFIQPSVAARSKRMPRFHVIKRVYFIRFSGVKEYQRLSPASISKEMHVPWFFSGTARPVFRFTTLAGYGSLKSYCPGMIQ